MADDDEQVQLMILVEALWRIAHDTEEVETLREAMAALSNTPAGRDYLETHPLAF